MTKSSSPTAFSGPFIRVKDARTHNLKGIDVDLPRDKMVVITGISGSGKSSLAFDTLYAEGQRRYIESLSTYARQFLQQMPRPDCDRVSGLPPTVAIRQDATVSGPQSTLATSTEIYDYMRLLFARVGSPGCPECGSPIESQSLQQVVAELASLPPGARLTLLAPLVRGRKGHYRDLLESIRNEGFVKVRIDGQIHDLDDVPRIDRYKTHDIDVVIDRLVVKDTAAQVSGRFADSVRTALKVGEGICIALRHGGAERMFNQRLACPRCKIGIEEPTPKLFSFNSPYGRCPACRGRGVVERFDTDLIVPDGEKSIEEGAIEPFHSWKGSTGARLRKNLLHLARAVHADSSKPFRGLHAEICRALLYGKGLGRDEAELQKMAVIPSLERLKESTGSGRTLRRLARYISPIRCDECQGTRLRPEALAVTIDGKNIAEITRMQVSEAAQFLGELRFTGASATIAAPILKELSSRLRFLIEVGLHYLGCDRLTGTLSTGESQRTRLATQIGSALTGVCYILDEPSIGLHHRDHSRLLDAMARLRDTGNSLIVVEHDAQTIQQADWILDLGPGAGKDGGSVLFNGPLQELQRSEKSLTARYISGRRRVPAPERRRTPEEGRYIRVRGAVEHNLKNINVDFPLGMLICVTGVSGSGKSTLVNDILLKALMRRINNSTEKPGRHGRIEGMERIDKVLRIDQAPIGKTPRSTPATYTKVFDHIRRVFADTKQSKVRGYGVGRFSFNNRRGRCQQCKGMGERKIEMSLLPDVKVQCEACHGRRYNEETLQVAVHGRHIADVLGMTVDEALGFFKNHPPIERRLRTMREVGLGYLRLDQPSNTLSGGEAQRIKLAAELGKISTGDTLYALDEPTTGLHFEDIKKLLRTLHGLVDLGNTILIIEHNLDVIKNADHIIDLGPEGGEAGGRLIAEGAPENLVKCRNSHTAAALREHLGRE